MSPPQRITVRSGEQTKITPRVQELADRLQGVCEEYIKNVSAWINGNNTRESEMYNSYRSVDEILESGYWSGCHEAGLIFASLLRAKGYETNYIQAIDNSVLLNWSEENIEIKGHVFLEVECKGKKLIVDSTTGEIMESIPENMIVCGIALDAWELGLRDHEDIISLFKQRHMELL